MYKLLVKRYRTLNVCLSLYSKHTETKTIYLVHEVLRGTRSL